MSKNIFFIRGFSVNGIRRLEDLVNFHPKVNCRGDFSFEGLGKYLNEFFDSKRSVIIYERNANLFKNSILKTMKDMMYNLCGKEFTRIGASSADSIVPLYVPGSKYLVVYQDMTDSVLSFLIYNLELGKNNIKLIDPGLVKLKGFQVMLKRHIEEPFDIQGVIDFLLVHPNLNKLWQKQWYLRFMKDYRMSSKPFVDTLWVNYSDLFTEYEEVMSQVFEFLGLANTKKIVYHETLSSGYYDYPHTTLLSDKSVLETDIRDDALELHAQIEQILVRPQRLVT